MEFYSRIKHYSSLLLIVVAAFVIHGSVMGRFWLADDPQVLLHAERYGPLEIVSEKSAWQELSTSNFTPLVTWSFDFDLAVFGPDPTLFYVHQIVSIALVALSLRLLMLALGVGRRASLMVTLLFLITPPTIHVSGLLMTRHYIEGLLVAVVSTLLWTIAIRRPDRRPVLIAGSVAAYLLALLAKEVFILLPLVMIALAAGRVRWRQIGLQMIPFALTLLAYMVWRSWMLESAGGYGGGNAIIHFFELTGQWIFRQPLVAVWFGLTIAICAVSWLRSRMEVLRFVLIAVAVAAPLFGIGDSIEGRHLLFPAVVLLAGSIGGIEAKVGERWRPALLLALLVVTVIAAASTIYREAKEFTRMEAEGRYVWEEGREGTALLAGSPGWYIDGLVELDSIWRDESSPEVVFSELGAFLEVDSQRYVVFGPDGMPRIEYLEDMSAIAEGYRSDAAMTLAVSRDDHELSWLFGPECDCEWRFYSYPGYQQFSLPREGRRVVPRPRDEQWFRIERRTRSGEWTLSPPLPLPEDGETTRWQRTD